MRRLIAFACHGQRLIGTLDEASGTTGLLIVSGGNEIRIGAHRGMAILATRLATAGTPVFRYDRRGIGDSSGTNSGYEGARDDLIAAADAFRAHAPHTTRIIGFGNCDGATTLALYGRDAGIGSLVLANPWLVQEEDLLPHAAAIRQHYIERLRDPRSWLRAVTGGVDIRKLGRGLRKLVAKRSEPDILAQRVIEAIRGWDGDARIVLAKGDATAIAFADVARRRGLEIPTTMIPTHSHSFARTGDAAALEDAIRAAI